MHMCMSIVLILSSGPPIFMIRKLVSVTRSYGCEVGRHKVTRSVLIDHFNASVQEFLTSVPSGDDREAKRIWLPSAYWFSSTQSRVQSQGSKPQSPLLGKISYRYIQNIHALDQADR